MFHSLFRSFCVSIVSVMIQSAMPNEVKFAGPGLFPARKSLSGSSCATVHDHDNGDSELRGELFVKTVTVGNKWRHTFCRHACTSL